MRIHVSFIDRVGITQEVLALLVGRNLNLDAVEMVPPNVYIDAPALSFTVLDELRGALLEVRGVEAVTVVDILPGQRRSLQLDALLAAMSDPVLAIDGEGRVLLANPALLQFCEQPPEGRLLAELFDDPTLAALHPDRPSREYAEERRQLQEESRRTQRERVELSEALGDVLKEYRRDYPARQDMLARLEERIAAWIP